ncbi:MAG: hypothetical protein LQ341_000132 [Variospora aurantia]|nr:MAG: hypothetical protein LQ341_000132 [Variospora aurantia]
MCQWGMANRFGEILVGDQNCSNRYLKQKLPESHGTHRERELNGHWAGSGSIQLFGQAPKEADQSPGGPSSYGGNYVLGGFLVTRIALTMLTAVKPSTTAMTPYRNSRAMETTDEDTRTECLISKGVKTTAWRTSESITLWSDF